MPGRPAGTISCSRTTRLEGGAAPRFALAAPGPCGAKQAGKRSYPQAMEAGGPILAATAEPAKPEGLRVARQFRLRMPGRRPIRACLGAAVPGDPGMPAGVRVTAFRD